MNASSFDYVITNGNVVNSEGETLCDVGIKGGKITALGRALGSRGKHTFDASGLDVIPGVIDTQVHLRDPGNPQVETIPQGSKWALQGGVTAFFEMPNTSPPTVSPVALDDKIQRARNACYTHYAFYGGAEASNMSLIKAMEATEGCCGIKAFLGSSTGSLLLDKEEDLRTLLKTATRRISFHCEDECRLKERSDYALEGNVATHPLWRDVKTALLSTERVLAEAESTEAQVHILHVTTAEEIETIASRRQGRLRGRVSCEVTPQHLTLSAPECYERLGAKAQMNPPLRDHRHQQALWKAVEKGVVDVIGSDHAPHSLLAKEKEYPQSPSGMPGVGTLLPVMLNHVAEGRLSMGLLCRLVCENPASIWGIIGKGHIALGYDADLVLVDRKAKKVVGKETPLPLCGWSPFEGTPLTGWPVGVFLDGELVMREGEILQPPKGTMLRFKHNTQAH